MKRTALSIFIILLLNHSIAQTTYTTFPDPKNNEVTIYKGMITKYLLQNEPSIIWYKQNQNEYNANLSIVTAMEAARKKFTFMIFGGSWCDDTQFILPRFFKLQELSGLPDSSISFFGVDREKKSIGNLSSIFNITNVPTIIVMKEGKEVGRVVEYGKSGSWENDLIELIK